MINHEEMSERKLKILHAIIQNYLETGEPVGSRTISKYTDLNLSSATIRNEMADLEEMGYIVQPHTSAGRIPTDKGYRLYVDDLMKEKVQELDNREKKVTERENLLFEKVDKVETLLQNMAKMLATNTNYATMISTSRDNEDKIKFIQLSLMDDNQILCIVVSGRNRVVNKIIKVKDQINESPRHAKSCRWRTIRGQRNERSCRPESDASSNRGYPSAHHEWCLGCMESCARRYESRSPRNSSHGRSRQ